MHIINFLFIVLQGTHCTYLAVVSMRSEVCQVYIRTAPPRPTYAHTYGVQNMKVPGSRTEQNCTQCL